MKKPLIAVVDWKQSPRGDKGCCIEKQAIGNRARVKYFLCDKDEDFANPIEPSCIGGLKIAHKICNYINETTLNNYSTIYS